MPRQPLAELEDPLLRPARVAAALGQVTRAELRSPLWEHPLHGVVRIAGTTVPQPDTRIADACALLSPDGVLGGWAAAYRSGVATLDGIVSTGAEQPVLLYGGSGHQLRRRPGIEPSRAVLPEDEVDLTADPPWRTSLARCALDEMCRAPDLTEAVVVLDCLLSGVTPGPSTTLAEVAELLRRHPRLRGAALARQACGWASDRSASRPETRLRVRAQRLGLRDLKVNWPVFGPAGELVAIVDLLDEESGLVLEYDGGGHAAAATRENDHRRQDVLEALNLTVVRFTSLMDSSPRLSDERIWRGRERARLRDRSADRWSSDIPPRWRRTETARRWALDEHQAGRRRQRAA